MDQRKTGILLSYLNFGLNALIMLIYVPMLLHYVSKEQYGIYQMIGSFIGVIAVLDFGLSATVTRFVARADAKNEPQQAQRTIDAAAFLYVILTGLLILISVGGYFLISPVYGHALSSADLATAQQIYLILVLNFAVCVPGNLFLGLVQAKERFVFLQCLYLCTTVLTPLAIWGALCWKANVVGVVWVQTAANISLVLGYYLYCKIRLHIHVHPRGCNVSLLKQLFGFSFFVFLGNIAGQISSRLGPLVLGLLAGALAVANYYIASQLLMAFTMIPSLISGVFLPKLSGDFATQNSLAVHNDIFCKTGRLQTLVALLLLIGFVLLGKVFLLLWLGPGNEVCYGLAIVLMSCSLLNIVQGVSNSVLMAINKYRFSAYLGIGTALLNVLLAFPLVKYYGTMGCAIALVLSTCLVRGILMNWYYHKIGLHLKAFFRALGPIAGWSIVVMIVLGMVWHYWPVQATWRSFILHGICIVAVYGAVMARFVLNRFEWDIVREICAKCHFPKVVSDN